MVDSMDAPSPTARRSNALMLRRPIQSRDATTMSTLSGVRRRRTGGGARRLRATNVISLPRSRGGCSKREGSFLGLARPRGFERRLVVGVDNARHELVPDD